MVVPLLLSDDARRSSPETKQHRSGLPPVVALVAFAELPVGTRACVLGPAKSGIRRSFEHRLEALGCRSEVAVLHLLLPSRVCRVREVALRLIPPLVAQPRSERDRFFELVASIPGESSFWESSER